MREHPPDNGGTSRRKMIELIGAASLTGLAGCMGSGGDSSQTTVQGRESFKYGNDKSFIGSTDIPFLWTMWERLPKKWDYTGEINLFEGMGPLTQAMRAGAIDVGSSSITQPAAMRTAGFDVKLFGVETAGTDYVHVVNTKLASSWDDFVGTNTGWGYSGAGGNSHLQPAAVFLDKGYDLDKVTWRKIGDSGTRTTALAGGKLAGASIHWSQWLKIKDIAPVKSLGKSVNTIPGGWIDGGVYAPKSWLEENRTAAVDLVASGIVAFEKVHNDFEWYWNLFQEHKRSEKSKGEVKSSWKKFKNQFGSWPLPKPFKEKGVTTIVETAKEAGVLSKDYKTEEFYTMSIQEEALNRLEDN